MGEGRDFAERTFRFRLIGRNADRQGLAGTRTPVQTFGMSYLDRPPRNWGVMIATALSVPAALIWVFVQIVGGAMACEGVDGPCETSLIIVLGGLLALAAAACALGWVLNLLIRWVRGDRGA